MADFWTKSCSAMPGTNDFVRMRLGPKDWIQHQIHSQWTKTRELPGYIPILDQRPVLMSVWGRFKARSRITFAVASKALACMCGKCENCRHMQSALNNNSQALAGMYGTKQEQALAVLGMLDGSTTTAWFTWKDVHVLGLVSTTTAWYLYAESVCGGQGLVQLQQGLWWLLLWPASASHAPLGHKQHRRGVPVAANGLSCHPSQLVCPGLKTN
jgi:hypothetical protein